MNRLNDMLSIMRSKTNQMEVALNRSHIANIDSSISPEITPVDATMSTEGLGKVVRFQQQIVRGKLLKFLRLYLNFLFFQILIQLDYRSGFGNGFSM